MLFNKGALFIVTRGEGGEISNEIHEKLHGGENQEKLKYWNEGEKVWNKE